MGNKVIGRMRPTSGTLLTRFAANVRENYLAVDRAWTAFAQANQHDAMYTKAGAWWQQIQDSVRDVISSNYVKASRHSDIKGVHDGRRTSICLFTDSHTTAIKVIRSHRLFLCSPPLWHVSSVARW